MAAILGDVRRVFAGLYLATLAIAARGQDFRVSVSVSPFTELVLNTGSSFTDGRITATTLEGVQRLFVSHGANEVYARIATTQKYRKGYGDHSMDAGLTRARMAASMGLPLNPELGLFDIYGDIRCQPAPDFTDYPSIRLPGPWASLTIDQMATAVGEYGAAAARQILATGVHVGVWDIGNEVEFGVAGVAVQPQRGGCEDTAGKDWYRAPDRVDPAIGRLSFDVLVGMPEEKRTAWLSQHLWPYEARLLGAVAGGIRTIDPRARFSTHVSGVAATQPRFTTAFFRAMRQGGFSPDELGVSYYPTSSAVPRDRLQAFKDMAVMARRDLGRPVFVAEFGYPAAKMGGMFSWNDAVAGYPQTPEGQADFVRALVEWGTREKVLSGIRPWAPDLALPGWAPMSLFAREGQLLKPRPALDAFRPHQR